MDSIDDIKNKIDKLNITQELLSKAAVMEQSQLSLLLNGKKSPTELTLIRLSNGIELIKLNRTAIASGAIVINEMDFRNKVYKVIMPILEEKEHNDTYNGNSHHLAQKLVTVIYEGITEVEE